jgi:hypothetical protein
MRDKKNNAQAAKSLSEGRSMFPRSAMTASFRCDLCCTMRLHGDETPFNIILVAKRHVTKKLQSVDVARPLHCFGKFEIST